MIYLESHKLGADPTEAEPGIFDIEGRAAAGAKKALKPILTGSLVISVAGLILGGAALVVAIRR